MQLRRIEMSGSNEIDGEATSSDHRPAVSIGPHAGLKVRGGHKHHREAARTIVLKAIDVGVSLRKGIRDLGAPPTIDYTFVAISAQKKPVVRTVDECRVVAQSEERCSNVTAMEHERFAISGSWARYECVVSDSAYRHPCFLRLVLQDNDKRNA